MKKIYKIIISLLFFLFIAAPTFAAINIVPNGGTGIGTIIGIPYGTGTAPLSIVTIGTGLSFTGGTLGCQTASGSQAGCLSSTDWTTFNNKGSGTVTSVSGTANRITSTGGATPVIDISASYIGQSSITTVGTLSSGAVPASLVTAGTFGTGAYTMNTSLTNPLLIGGTAIGSSLTLKSTSGVGTTDYINALVGNNGGTEAWRTLHNGILSIGETSNTFIAPGTLATNSVANLQATTKTAAEASVEGLAVFGGVANGATLGVGFGGVEAVSQGFYTLFTDNAGTYKKLQVGSIEFKPQYSNYTVSGNSYATIYLSDTYSSGTAGIARSVPTLQLQAQAGSVGGGLGLGSGTNANTLLAPWHIGNGNAGTFSSVANIMILDNRSAGGLSAGTGPEMQFYQTDASRQKQLGAMSMITTTWSGSPTADWYVSTVNAGTVSEKLRVTGAGLINIPGLTASQGVATDASKNLISVTNSIVVGSDRKTGLTAAQALATYTVGATDTTFKVSANVLITASTLHSFSVTCSYTDESNTARVLTLNFSQLTGAFVTTLTNALGASAYEGVPVHIRAKAGTTIIVASTGTFTTVTYNLEERILQE